MFGFSRNVSVTTLLLFACIALIQFVTGFYAAAGVEPNPGLIALGPIGLLWALCSWLQSDIRSRGLHWTLDLGLFVYFWWIFVLPYYLIKTRGARGMIGILTFIGVYVGSLVAGIGLYFLLNL